MLPALALHDAGSPWRAIVLTTVWWLGTLPLLGIGLAVTLTLPLVFINCIGSERSNGRIRADELISRP